MKYDMQDCFHVSAAEADTWKRRLATPAESVMLQEAERPEPGRPPRAGTLFRNA